MLTSLTTRLAGQIPPLAQDAIGALALMVALLGGLHLPGLF